MAPNSGGSETSRTTTVTGTNVYAEIRSQGGTQASVTSIPATPTGRGYVYQPGAGTFATGNWSASATFAASNWGGSPSNTDITMRFFKYSSGVYTSIGTLNVGVTSISKTTYSFSATSMSSVTFGASDLLYVDLWWHDTNTSTQGDDPVVYVSTSATAGVVNDMQITTSTFTPSGGGVTRRVFGDGMGGLFK